MESRHQVASLSLQIFSIFNTVYFFSIYFIFGSVHVTSSLLFGAPKYYRYVSYLYRIVSFGRLIRCPA